MGAVCPLVPRTCRSRRCPPSRKRSEGRAWLASGAPCVCACACACAPAGDVDGATSAEGAIRAARSAAARPLPVVRPGVLSFAGFTPFRLFRCHIYFLYIYYFYFFNRRSRGVPLLEVTPGRATKAALGEGASAARRRRVAGHCAEVEPLPGRGCAAPCCSAGRAASRPEPTRGATYVCVRTCVQRESFCPTVQAATGGA